MLSFFISQLCILPDPAGDQPDAIMKKHFHFRATGLPLLPDILQQDEDSSSPDLHGLRFDVSATLHAFRSVST